MTFIHPDLNSFYFVGKILLIDQATVLKMAKLLPKKKKKKDWKNDIMEEPQTTRKYSERNVILYNLILGRISNCCKRQ